MAITRNAPPVSWDDLLAAIDPQPLSPEENLRHVVETCVQLHGEGQITDADFELLLREAIAHMIDHEVNGMVTSFLSPSRHRMRGEGFPGDFSFL